jgi:hypothetical protein
MRLLPRAVATGLATLAILAAVPASAQSPSQLPAAPAPEMSKMPHRVVIQVSENDAAVMNTALNNAQNLSKFYKDRGESVEIELVAFGPGLSMMRSDTSPVKNRLASMANNMKNITFSGCGNTMANMSKKEKKTITLLPEARIVPTGIARIVELQELGWTYVRP